MQVTLAEAKLHRVCASDTGRPAAAGVLVRGRIEIHNATPARDAIPAQPARCL